jgi:AcrR family transcriptional regulator
MEQQPDAAAGAKRRRGRPRDPDIEARVYGAAAAVYGEAGWRGFTFEAIMRRSGVGKASLYARWPTRGELLRDLVAARWQAMDAIDFGDLRADLRAFARLVLARYLETGGGVALHIRRDAATWPEVAEAVGPAMRDLSRRCAEIVRRAKARGEAPADLESGLIPEMLTAALEVYASSLFLQLERDGRAPEGLTPAMEERLDRMTDLLVDGVRRV